MPIPLIRRRFALLFVPLALLAFLASPVAASTSSDSRDLWSSFRGPFTDAQPNGLLPDGEFGLAVQWRRDLGDGYSGISVADGRVFTMFTRGEDDVIAAFDARDGSEQWSHVLGPKYIGHTGSEDGPLSTPAIDDGVVFAVGARGQVVALEADTGERVWLYEMDEDNSTVPFYGYTTSPVLYGDAVLVASGGEGTAVTALDRFTGEPKWQGGKGTVSYQTPSIVSLDGRDVLVLVTNQLLQGLDLETGRQLWELRHTEGNGSEESAHVTPVGKGRFVVDYDRGAVLYEATTSGAEEVWRSRAFANSLDIPERFGDHLYGFTRGILTCADLATGEIVWRSREPGGQGITRVGDVLALLDAEGNLVLVDPSPEGYREVTRVAALDAISTHFPSFDNGTFLVRNGSEMAAVRADASLRPASIEVQVTDAALGAFGEWVASVEALPSARRQAAVDQRFAEVERAPLFDGADSDQPGLVHFVWRGAAEDVGLGGDIVNGQEIGLERLAGTDLFYRSLELVPSGQYNYTFSIDFGPPSVDPLNPYSTDQGFLVTSDLRMPRWPNAPHLDEPAADAARGSLDGFQFRSAALGNTRQIQLWKPADYGQDPDRRYPLLVVNHGDNQVRGALMTRTLDNLVGQSVEPLVAVFVPRVAPPEYGGEQADAYTRFLVEELLPHLRRHYQIAEEGYGILGPGSAGVASLYASLHHPQLFDRVALQSFYPIEPGHEVIAQRLEGEGEKPRQVFVVYSNQDYDLGDGVRAAEASQELLDALGTAGVETRALVTDYTPNWGGWRGQHDDILQWLFPLSESDG